MIWRLDFLCRVERRLLVLCELDRVLHPLEVQVDLLVHLYELHQGLSEWRYVWRANLYVPFYEVIHEALGRNPVEPHVLLILCREIILFNLCDDLFFQSGVRVLVKVIHSMIFLVDSGSISLCHCCVHGTMFCVRDQICRLCVTCVGDIFIDCCIHQLADVAITSPPKHRIDGVWIYLQNLPQIIDGLAGRLINNSIHSFNR